MSAQKSHSTIKPEASKGSAFLLTLGLLLLLIVVIVGGKLLSHSSNATETEDADRAAVRTKNLAELQTADSAQLSTYGWNDNAKGIAHIPITRAMELVLPVLNAPAAKTDQAPALSAAPSDKKQP